MATATELGQAGLQGWRNANVGKRYLWRASSDRAPLNEIRCRLSWALLSSSCL